MTRAVRRDPHEQRDLLWRVMIGATVVAGFVSDRHAIDYARRCRAVFADVCVWCDEIPTPAELAERRRMEDAIP